MITALIKCKCTMEYLRELVIDDAVFIPLLVKRN